MAPTGTQRLTADGVIGISGAPIIVYNMIVRADGVGAADVTLRDGTGTGDTATDTLESSGANTTARANYGTKGLLLVSGGFIDIGSNVSFVVVTYEQLRTS